MTINHAVEELNKFLAARGGREWPHSSLLERRGHQVGDHRLRRTSDSRRPRLRCAGSAYHGLRHRRDLWCQESMYIQPDFIIRRLAEKATADASLADSNRKRLRQAATWTGSPARSRNIFTATTPTSKRLWQRCSPLTRRSPSPNTPGRVNALFAKAQHRCGLADASAGATLPTLGRAAGVDHRRGAGPYPAAAGDVLVGDDILQPDAAGIVSMPCRSR